MSRFADAIARAARAADRSQPVSWEHEHSAVQALLSGTPAAAQPPTAPGPAVPVPAPVIAPAAAPRASSPVPAATIQPRPSTAAAPTPLRQGVPSEPSDLLRSELARAVRELFLAGSTSARSVLFVTIPGDEMTDAAWRAAEILATLSSRRVAFVEDGSHSVATSRPRAGQGSITKIWSYDEAALPPAEIPSPANYGAGHSDVVGSCLADVVKAFDFVVINATAPTADDLVPLASEVDGVVILVAKDGSDRKAARLLADTLRSASANLLGVVLTEDPSA